MSSHERALSAVESPSDPPNPDLVVPSAELKRRMRTNPYEWWHHQFAQKAGTFYDFYDFYSALCHQCHVP